MRLSSDPGISDIIAEKNTPYEPKSDAAFPVHAVTHCMLGKNFHIQTLCKRAVYSQNENRNPVIGVIFFLTESKPKAETIKREEELGSH